jgi:peroxiredoxin
MQINQPAPDFELTDLNGKVHHLKDYRGKIVILNFWSAECPHSERADLALMTLLEQWADEVAPLSILANRNEMGDGLAQAFNRRRLPVLLLDGAHQVADLYGAQTTPHLFVVDRAGILRYRGALDDVTFRQRTPTRFFLKEAVEALLMGNLPALTETPAYGCTIVREI